MNQDPTTWQIEHDYWMSTLEECMSGKGFILTTKSMAVPSSDSYYGVTDPSFAVVYGYKNETMLRLEEMGQGDQPDGLENLTVVTNPPGYDEALSGLEENSVQIKMDDGRVLSSYDPDSCTAVADHALSADYDRESVLFEQLSTIMVEAALATEQRDDYLSGQEDWSQCMQGQGFDYATPSDALNANAEEGDVSAHQIEVAVADANCKQDTGFLKTWSAAMAAEQQARLDEHPGIYTEWLDIQQKKHDVAVTG